MADGLLLEEVKPSKPGTEDVKLATVDVGVCGSITELSSDRSPSARLVEMVELMRADEDPYPTLAGIELNEVTVLDTTLVARVDVVKVELAYGAVGDVKGVSVQVSRGSFVASEEPPKVTVFLSMTAVLTSSLEFEVAVAVAGSEIEVVTGSETRVLKALKPDFAA